MSRATLMLLVALAIVPLAGQGPRRVSLILSGGIVITIDGGHRVLRPGAVAIEGSDIVAVGIRRGIAADTRGESRRHHGRHRASRLGEHARPCADGALSRAGRRPRADGVASAVHLPGRSEDRVAGDGARRHSTGRARDDPVGDDDVHRHVLLRGGNRAGARGTRDCAACSARPSSSFPVPTRRRRPRRWRAPKRSSGSSGATR